MPIGALGMGLGMQWGMLEARIKLAHACGYHNGYHAKFGLFASLAAIQVLLMDWSAHSVHRSLVENTNGGN